MPEDTSVVAESPAVEAPAVESSPPDAGSWFDSLPDDIKSDPTVSHFKGKDVGDLAKSLVETKKMVGSDKMVIPGKNATQEQWDEIYSKLGRPSEPGEYGLDKIEVPESAHMDEVQVEFFGQLAHKLGLNSKQAATAFAAIAEMRSGQVNQMAEKYEELRNNAETEMRSEYGAAFEKNLVMAKSVVTQFFPEDSLAELDQFTHNGVQLTNSPTFIKGMVALAKGLGEDRVVGMADRGSGHLTPQEASLRAQEKLADPAFKKVYTNPSDPGYKAAQEEMFKLHEMAAGVR